MMTINTNSPIPVSFEFFPPKSEQGLENLLQTYAQLKQVSPEYCSVTYGAGGATQQGTVNTVLTLQKTETPCAPHISCIGSSKSEIATLLTQYQQAGVKRIVALRGDLPSGMVSTGGDFNYASDLIRFIREEFGNSFHIEIAAYPEKHPQAVSLKEDIDHFVYKAQCGADSAITQYFFNVNAYQYFVDQVRQRGCDIDIVPGIMPITNFEKLIRFSQGCHAEIPIWLKMALAEHAHDSAKLHAFGIDIVANICAQLISIGAPKLHFYSMNRASPTLDIIRKLNH